MTDTPPSSTPEAETVEPRWHVDNTLDKGELWLMFGDETFLKCAPRYPAILKRIVAALNSVEGISTEELEALPRNKLADLWIADAEIVESFDD